MSPRPYLQREGRLVTEWVIRTFPQAQVVFRARLGAVDVTLADTQLTEPELRAVGVIRRFVDALVIEPERVHLVEAKLRSVPGALEQLDLYARLLPLTPEYQQVRDRPITRHLVWVIRDPVVEALARERGILVHEYHPAWVDEYLKQLTPRMQKGTEPGGLFGLSPTARENGEGEGP
ncbi:MAG: hypothetical protein ACREKK_00420 [Candidatus Methylomirabilales bacterium]